MSTKPTPMLVYFHCVANTGYAIGHLERTFLEVARQVTGSDERIHFAYSYLIRGYPEFLPDGWDRVLPFNPRTTDRADLRDVESYVRRHGIQIAMGFDLPVRQKSFGALRRGGVKTLIGYWGAPMSGPASGARWLAKRAQVALSSGGPDHYIFESTPMQQTGLWRGIPARKTSVIPTGIDPEVFRPLPEPNGYAHEAFGIPRDRQIVFYSGHMEERKGVHVIVKAAVELVNRGVRDVHFLILGNKGEEAKKFDALYRGTAAESHITFGGYRSDVPQIMPSCALGTIASTGWDSFPMSSIEMAACGLPLVASRLDGLLEAVDDGVTGVLFEPGNHMALADHLARLLTDSDLRQQMSRAARDRALGRYTKQHQIASLAKTIRQVHERVAG